MSGMKIWPSVILVAGIALGYFGAEYMQNVIPPLLRKPHALSNAPGSCALKENMRTIWAHDVLWSRLSLIESLHALPGLSYTSKRLMQNQDDLGSLFKEYYGEKAGDNLAQLFKDYTNLALSILKAAQKKQLLQARSLGKKWKKNIEEIAEHLNSLNPAWDKRDVIKILNTYMELTGNEAWAHIKDKTDDEIDAVDKRFDHAMDVADLLANGIIEQFPQQFTCTVAKK